MSDERKRQMEMRAMSGTARGSRVQHVVANAHAQDKTMGERNVMHASKLFFKKRRRCKNVLFRKCTKMQPGDKRERYCKAIAARIKATEKRD